MRKVGSILMALICLAFHANAQQSISKANEKVIQAAAMQTAENYTSYLELLAMEVDKDLIEVYKAELLKSVDRDSIFVFNDLVPPESRSASVRENIDPLLTYLDDISSRYIEGVSIVYSDLKPTSIFIDDARQRLFTKVTSTRSLSGKYFYKNDQKQVDNTEEIDFYISISLKESGVPESKIYSVFQHDNNVSKFKAIKVVEKTAPIVFQGFVESNILKRNTEHTIVWEGGELFERLNVSIYQQSNDEFLMPLDSSVLNDNSYTFFLPASIKPGKGNPYYFQIQKLSSEEEPIKSEVFFVKRKTPMWIKAAVPVVVGAGIYLLIESTKTDPPVPGDEVPKIDGTSKD